MDEAIDYGSTLMFWLGVTEIEFDKATECGDLEAMMRYGEAWHRIARQARAIGLTVPEEG